MRQVTRELRGAYVSMLSNLTYKGGTIPVKSFMLNGAGAKIDMGSGVEFEAYINIINQFRASNKIKNGMVYTTSITLDINTVFSGDSYSMAGAEWVEEITDLVNDRMYNDEVFKLKEFGINYDRFVVTSTNSFSQPMPLQYTDSSRVFRSVLVFEHGIHHIKLDVPIDDFWIITE